MSVINVDTDGLLKKVIPDYDDALISLNNLKSIFNDMEVPYDFKYFGYLVNLREDLKNNIKTISSIEKMIDESMDNYNSLVRDSSKIISSKKKVEVPKRRKIVN